MAKKLLPPLPRLIMQLGSLLSSHVLNVQTPQCARPREAGAPRRSQILDPPSPSNNTRRGERHRLPRATAIYQKKTLPLALFGSFGLKKEKEKRKRKKKKKKNKATGAGAPDRTGD